VDEKAAAANVTRDQWLTENLAVPEPSEVDIQRVLTQYRSRLPEDENQARLQVTQFLMQQAGQQAQADLLAKLKAEANITVFLEPPRVESTETGHSPFRGAPDAPITIVEYTDFQCPYCERVQPVLESLRERYGDSIRHVFKNLPLPMHREADLAAQAGLCAFEQDSEGFWGLHDWMFANRQNLSIETITAQAEPNGLDAAALGACLQEGRYMEAVQQDAAEANAFGITGTPGFVVNGRMLKGAQPLEAFEAIIDDELQRAGLPVPEPAVPAEPRLLRPAEQHSNCLHAPPIRRGVCVEVAGSGNREDLAGVDRGAADRPLARSSADRPTRCALAMPLGVSPDRTT
jgi:protein-disulfide isomerase